MQVLGISSKVNALCYRLTVSSLVPIRLHQSRALRLLVAVAAKPVAAVSSRELLLSVADSFGVCVQLCACVARGCVARHTLVIGCKRSQLDFQLLLSTLIVLYFATFLPRLTKQNVKIKYEYKTNFILVLKTHNWHITRIRIRINGSTCTGFKDDRQRFL